MENRCGNSWVILKVPTKKEKESYNNKCYNNSDNGRKWAKDMGKKKKKKKVVLTILGAEARFSLSAPAAGILESCSQILQSPSWATPWLQVTASVMARRGWALPHAHAPPLTGLPASGQHFWQPLLPPPQALRCTRGARQHPRADPGDYSGSAPDCKPARIFLLLKTKKNQKQTKNPTIS